MSSVCASAASASPAQPYQRLLAGRSLRGVLRGAPPADWREAVYYRYVSHGDASPAHLGVRTRTHKLIFWYSHACSRHAPRG